MIRISQQDLLGTLPMQFPVPILSALAGEDHQRQGCLFRHEQSQFKAGNPGSGGSYSIANYSPADVARVIADRVPWYVRDRSALLCNKLHVASVGQVGSHTWADRMPIANHAKTMMVDDAAFYVGSHNMYPANLQEFGFIVEDQGAARQYLENYWNPLWEASKNNAVSGHDAPTCIFR